MKINPNALVFWGFLTLVGYLIGGGHTALMFLAAGLGVSLLASFLR